MSPHKSHGRNPEGGAKQRQRQAAPVPVGRLRPHLESRQTTVLFHSLITYDDVHAQALPGAPAIGRAMLVVLLLEGGGVEAFRCFQGY